MTLRQMMEKESAGAFGADSPGPPGSAIRSFLARGRAPLSLGRLSLASRPHHLAIRDEELSSLMGESSGTPDWVVTWTDFTIYCAALRGWIRDPREHASWIRQYYTSAILEEWFLGEPLLAGVFRSLRSRLSDLRIEERLPLWFWIPTGPDVSSWWDLSERIVRGFDFTPYNPDLINPSWSLFIDCVIPEEWWVDARWKRIWVHSSSESPSVHSRLRDGPLPWGDRELVLAAGALCTLSSTLAPVDEFQASLEQHTHLHQVPGGKRPNSS